MSKWIAASFLVLGGALLAFLLAFRNPVREQAPVFSGEAATLYRETCAVCHGARGEGIGELGLPLRGRALPVSVIRETIRRGRNKMPALPHIRGEALQALARYVHELP